jgi:hypothetical protein
VHLLCMHYVFSILTDLLLVFLSARALPARAYV